MLLFLFSLFFHKGLLIVVSNGLQCIQLFRVSLSYERGKAYAAMSKVMGNGGFYGCLIEPQGVSAWWKETAQTHVFMLSPSLLLNHLETQSSKA